jgi:hypothetical protein
MMLRTYGLWFLLLLLLLCLPGCQALGFAPQGYDPQLTANQIKAIASDRSAGIVCSLVPTPWGVAKVLTVNVDQRVIDNGGVTVSPDCTITFATAKPAPVAKEKP